MKNLLWSVARVSRLSLCATLISSGLLLLAPQAHAAHWAISYKPDGLDTPAMRASPYDPIEITEWLTHGKLFGTYNTETGRIDVTGDLAKFQAGAGDLAYLSQGDTVNPAISCTSLDRTGSLGNFIPGRITFYVTWVQDTTDTMPVPAPTGASLKIWGSAYATRWSSADLGTLVTQFGNQMGSTTTLVDPHPEEPNFNASYNGVSEVIVGESDPIVIPITAASGETFEYTFHVGASAQSAEYSIHPWDSNWYGGPTVGTQIDVNAKVS
ncbi:MAG: hypothetical protein KY445_16055 [Armatimonadetes bacterium]|nr:hypothetical protein [Armatimonadota bacterium]